MLMIFAGRLAAANSDIPICHKLWNALGKDLEGWRERCLHGYQKSYSQSCKAEKEYFKNRRLSHRQMCFYEGK